MANSIARALRPGWRWLFAIGLGVPLLVGVALALGVLISLLSDGYEPPDTIEAGRVDAFAVGAPILDEEADVWLVRLSNDEFLALYDRGLESGCPLQWRSSFAYRGRRGWFVDACNGAAYDLTGRCFSDPCRGALLDRFAVNLARDNVIVDLLTLQRDLPVDASAAPVNPPAE